MQPYAMRMIKTISGEWRTTPNSPRAVIDTVAHIKRDPHLFCDEIQKHLEEINLVPGVLKIAAKIRPHLREHAWLDLGKRLDDKIDWNLAQTICEAIYTGLPSKNE